MTEQTAEQEVFAIPAVNMERLIKEVNKLNARANKLRFPMMEIIVVKEYQIVHPDYTNRKDIDEDKKPLITMRDVRIAGEPPKVEGYEFVGTLDHYSIPGSVIVRAVPGQSVPTEFHNREAVCDHCGKKRNRTETFVLREEVSGKHICVGRQCVRDFIGYDVAALARYLERWRSLSESFSDYSDDRWWGGRIINTYDKISVLAATFGTIRVRGWRARSACADDEVPTSHWVCEIFEPPMFTGPQARQLKAEYDEFVRDVKSSDEDDRFSAESAIEWLDDQNDTNEYMHNLKVLRNAESIPMGMFGFWCSLAAAYQKAMDRLRLEESNRKKQTNDWVGGVKDRLNFEVTVVSINTVDGHYGPVSIHRMLDKDGHTLVWFANTKSGMERGQSYTIKGTVKKHDEYNNWKQTILSRVAVVD